MIEGETAQKGIGVIVFEGPVRSPEDRVEESVRDMSSMSPNPNLGCKLKKIN